VALRGISVDYLVWQCAELVADLFLVTRIVADENSALNRILGQNEQAKAEERADKYER